MFLTHFLDASGFSHRVEAQCQAPRRLAVGETQPLPAKKTRGAGFGRVELLWPLLGKVFERYCLV